MASWVFPALLAVVFWGLWAFFPKIAVRHINPLSALVFETLGVLLVGMVAAGVAGRDLETATRGAVAAILAGVCGSIGLYFFYGALRQGPVSMIAAFSALYPAVTVVLAVALLGERLSAVQAMGVVLAIIAGCLLAVGS